MLCRRTQGVESSNSRCSVVLPRRLKSWVDESGQCFPASCVCVCVAGRALLTVEGPGRRDTSPASNTHARPLDHAAPDLMANWFCYLLMGYFWSVAVLYGETHTQRLSLSLSKFLIPTCSRTHHTHPPQPSHSYSSFSEK